MDGAALERLRAAEAEARAGKRGIWSEEGAAGEDEAPFVASRNGKYIHRRECEYAKRINPKNAMKFYTLDAAVSTGRGRCPGCLGRGAGTPKDKKNATKGTKRENTKTLSH
jgi:hypothetical protein